MVSALSWLDLVGAQGSMHERGLYPQGKMDGSYAMLNACGWALGRHGCLWTILID